MSSFQYWRLNFNGPTNGAGTNPISIAEVVFYDGTGVTTVSTSGGTASASTVFSGSFVAANAFDGNAATAWASTVQPSSGSPQTLQMQFTGAVTIAFLSLKIRNDTSAWLTQAPTAFQVQGSTNGTTWTTLQTFTGIIWGLNGNGAGEVKFFDAASTVGQALASQVATETILAGAVARVNQVAIEVLGGSNPNVILSQLAVEIMYPFVQPTPKVIMEMILP